MRPAILDVGVGIGRRALDGDVADHFAGDGAGGAKRQPDIIARQVAGEQQIALGIVAVEHRPPGQLAQVAGDGSLGAGGVAAHPDLGHPRHQHAEPDYAVGDPLLGHFDRRDVAGVAQDRRRPVANFAHRGNRLLAADHRGISGRQLGRVDFLEAVELDAAKREPDRLEFGRVERARRPLDRAFDLEPERALLQRLGVGASHFLASWRQHVGSSLGDRLDRASGEGRPQHKRGGADAPQLISQPKTNPFCHRGPRPWHATRMPVITV